MFTRQQYMNGLVTFDEYYGQFVTAKIKKIVLNHFNLKLIKKAYAADKHFNNIPLSKWDNISHEISVDYKAAGDLESLAGNVCVLKAAAKMIVLESIKTN